MVVEELFEGGGSELGGGKILEAVAVVCDEGVDIVNKLGALVISIALESGTEIGEGNIVKGTGGLVAHDVLTIVMESGNDADKAEVGELVKTLVEDVPRERGCDQ